jgi:hypothetical protein
MANANRDTTKIIEEFGGKKVWPPQRLHKNHVRGDQPWGEGQKLLIGVVETPFGQYLKELSYEYALDSAKGGIYAVHYYEISQPVAEKLKKHPRSSQIFG